MQVSNVSLPPQSTLGASTALTQYTAHTATSSFKPPTAPRPADYKTPPRGPSFSPITPPQVVADTNSNAAPPHPPLQYPSAQRFQSYLSSIDFSFNDGFGPHSMFAFPTPTDVQEETPPPPRLASQALVPAAGTSLAEQGYMNSVRIVMENIGALVFLMLPEPER